MLRSVFLDGDFEERESVKDYFGNWICEGMYVNEVNSQQQRQGWVTEVVDENRGLGKIKVLVVSRAGELLDEKSSYVTEFEKAKKWCKALVDG